MNNAIEYFDRYTGRVEKEAVYGERWLSWAYTHPLGRLSTWAVARRAFFSRLYGRLMDRPSSRDKIEGFVKQFGLNPAEFAEPDSYCCFNDFFVRRLKPEARPITPDADAVAFPADARHLGWQDFSKPDGLLVKGERFELRELLGDDELARRFEGGPLVISRLCPTDYHRFHFPLEGLPSESHLLPGPLDSVNPIALRRRIRILSTNKRALSILKTPSAGEVALIEVGASCVGSIIQTYQPGQAVARGDEKGYFKFGGSTVITVFEPGRVLLANDLVAQTSEGRELYARMGDQMGHLVS